ncbi:MAG: MFS transporter [Firmicutes bacterium]|nr:MFS transporter [Bacillota bacterium]
MNAKKLPFFYGWVIVAMSCLLIFAVVGCGHNCWSVFTLQMCEDLGMSRQQFSAFYTVMSVTQIFTLMIIDKVFKKLGQLNTMRIFAVAMPLSLFAISRVGSAAGFYFFGIVLGFGTVASSFYSLAIIISKWFIDKKGTATGLVFMSSPLGSMILVPLVTGWAADMGWRKALVMLSLVMGVITAGITFIFLKEKPEDMGLVPYTEKSGSAGASGVEERPVDPDSLWGFTRVEALKLAGTWLFIAALAGNYMASSCNTVLIPYLQDIGFSPRTASIVQAAGMGSVALARFLGGRLSDRFGCARVLRVSLGLSPLFLFGMLIVSRTRMILPVLILGYGCTMIISTVMLPLTTGRFFGRMHYSSVLGLFNACGSAMGATVPLLLGTVCTIYGSYLPAFKIFFATTVLSFIIINLFIKVQAKAREKKILEQAPEKAKELLNTRV